MTLTDDDLGARLHTALQQVSPLATDPVPPPRFAPDTVAAPTDLTSADVVEIGAVPPRAPSRRRLAYAAAVLAAAAVAAGVVVATTDLGSDTTGTVGPGTSVGGPAPSFTPPAGTVSTNPDVWRCTAPAGTTITAALQSDRTAQDQVWAVGAGVTCEARPDERGRYVLEQHGFTVPGEAPAFAAYSGRCVTAGSSFEDGATSSSPDLVVPSLGTGSYLEFFGPGCYLLLP